MIHAYVLIIVNRVFFETRELAANLSVFKGVIASFDFSDLGCRLVGGLGVSVRSIVVILVTLTFVFMVDILGRGKVYIHNTVTGEGIIVE